MVDSFRVDRKNINMSDLPLVMVGEGGGTQNSSVIMSRSRNLTLHIINLSSCHAISLPEGNLL